MFLTKKLYNNSSALENMEKVMKMNCRMKTLRKSIGNMNKKTELENV